MVAATRGTRGRPKKKPKQRSAVSPDNVYIPVGFCDPQWRWARIEYLVSQGKNPDKRDDVETRALFRYMREYRDLQVSVFAKDSRFDFENAALSSRFPVEADVVSIYEASSFLRFSLEALLLTDASEEEIYAYTGCTPDVVRMYATIFFDVSRIKKHKLLLINWVFGDSALSGLSPKNRDKFWKAVAIYGGKEMLFDAFEYGNMTEESKIKFDAWIQGQCQRNTMQAATYEVADRFTSQSILERYGNTQRLEFDERKLAGGSNSMQGDFREAYLGMMQSFTLSVRESSVKDLPAIEAPETRKLHAALLFNEDSVKSNNKKKSPAESGAGKK